MIKKYKVYKDIKFNHLREIPIDWTLLKIKFIANIYTGDSLNDDYKTLFESEELDHLAYISSKDIDVDTSKVQYETGLRIPLDFGKFKIAKKNNSLLCIEGGSAGRKMAFINQDVFFVNKLACFATEDPINSKFIFYCLRSDVFQTQFFNSIAGLIGGVSISNLKNFYFPFPVYNDKVRIVRFLDHQTSLIDELIQRKEKQIELLKEKRLSIINEVVTKGLDPNAKMKDSGVEYLGTIPEHWKLKRLKYIFRIKKEISGELGHDVLSVTQKGIKIKDLDNYKGQLSMDYSKYQLVKKGEFIMNHMDLLTGWIDISPWNGVTSPDYRVFQLEDKNNTEEFFLHIFQLCYSNKIFFGLGQGVSQLGRWRMPSEQFNNFVVPVPPQIEQSNIVNFIKKKITLINNLMEQLLNQLEKLKEYRQSLISEAVTGKIDVRDCMSDGGI